LRNTTIELETTLPDGRVVQVRVGMAHDEYIPAREEQTVVLELRTGAHVVATLNTVLEPEQEEQALELASEVVDALASGHVEPTAAALEQYADRLR
jgi:hypothetical protein